MKCKRRTPNPDVPLRVEEYWPNEFKIQGYLYSLTPDAVIGAAQVGMLETESENVHLKPNSSKRMQF